HARLRRIARPGARGARDRGADPRRDLRVHAAAAARSRMTGGRPMWALLSNETRALAPTWIVCVLTASVAALTGGDAHRYSTFAFIAATASLGALSIRHEYGHP